MKNAATKWMSVLFVGIFCSLNAFAVKKPVFVCWNIEGEDVAVVPEDIEDGYTVGVSALSKSGDRQNELCATIMKDKDSVQDKEMSFKLICSGDNDCQSGRATCKEKSLSNLRQSVIEEFSRIEEVTAPVFIGDVIRGNMSYTNAYCAIVRGRN